mmetsp:Transcript_44677/g.43288  ORF Transcript_44677/g.43288 Transcript_44677/m.43288 type:complete len:87 (+) Transcript_44677:436-696(+)
MSKQEQNMQTIVEDLSEEMKREREEELRASRGSASIAFFDLAHMSTTGKLMYLVGILGFFVLIFYVLINKLLVKPVDFNKQKRSER